MRYEKIDFFVNINFCQHLKPKHGYPFSKEFRLVDKLNLKWFPVKSVNFLFVSTLSTQKPPDPQAETHREVEQMKERLEEIVFRPDLHQRLEEMLQKEREERSRLELEKEKLRQEKEMLEEQREREEG